MTTKTQAYLDAAIGKGCLGKADGAEEIFVLRGQDASAPEVVRYWAELNKNTLRPEKYDEALACADRMEKTLNRKRPD